MEKFLQRYLYKKPARKLAAQIKSAVDTLSNTVPILVVSYNNGIYVDHCVRQLNARSIKPVIIDNASTDAETLAILSEMIRTEKAFVVRSAVNMGARAGFQNRFMMFYRIFSAIPIRICCSIRICPQILFNS